MYFHIEIYLNNSISTEDTGQASGGTTIEEMRS